VYNTANVYRVTFTIGSRDYRTIYLATSRDFPDTDDINAACRANAQLPTMENITVTGVTKKGPIYYTKEV